MSEVLTDKRYSENNLELPSAPKSPIDLKSGSDSGIGSSDSASSMNDVKEHFQVIMNLKALAGAGDNIDLSVNSNIALKDEIMTNCNGNSNDDVEESMDCDDGDDELKLVIDDDCTIDEPENTSVSDNQTENSNESEPNDSRTVKQNDVTSRDTSQDSSTVCKDSKNDDEIAEMNVANGHENLKGSDNNDKVSDQTSVSDDKGSNESSGKVSDGNNDKISVANSVKTSDVNSDKTSDVNSDKTSDVNSDETSDMVNDKTSNTNNDKVSIDCNNKFVEDDCVVKHNDKVSGNNSDVKNNDKVSEDNNDKGSNDKPSVIEVKPDGHTLDDHPLNLDDKVKQSVRDIVSKLKQGMVSDFKFLKKPKHENVNVDQSESSKNVDQSDSLTTKKTPITHFASKGNLFENLTVISVSETGTKSINMKETILNTNQNASSTPVEVVDTQESDILLIEDAYTIKKDEDDDDIIFCEEPIKKQISKARPQSGSELKNEVEDKDKLNSKLEASNVSMEVDSKSDKDKAVCCDNRKRSPDEDSVEESDVPPKRSRLDMMIGKLGTQIGICPDAVKSDSFDEESHESRPESEVTDKSDDESTLSDDDDEKTSSPEATTKAVKITSQELEVLVRRKVAAYLKEHRDEHIAALQAKLTALQKASDTWKTNARDLQRQVVDLTVLQKRVDRRKALAAVSKVVKLKSAFTQTDKKESKDLPKTVTPSPPSQMSPIFQLTNSLSTPVTTTSTAVKLTTITPTTATGSPFNSMSQLLCATALSRNTGVSLIPSLGPAHVVQQQIAQPMVLQPSVSQPPVAQASVVVPQAALMAASSIAKSTTVRRLLDTKTGVMLISHSGIPSTPVTTPVAGVAAINPNKVIDLTSDDESTKAPSPNKPAPRAMQVIPAPIRPQSLVQQQLIQGLTPQMTNLQSLHNGASILLSSTAGLVAPTAAGVHRPPAPGTYQIMTVASGSALRPGTLLTVMPAASGPATTQQSSVRTTVPTVLPLGTTGVMPLVSNQVAHLRPIMQTTPVMLSSNPTPVTSGISMRAPPPLHAANAQLPVVQITPPQPAPKPKHPAPLPTRPVSQVVQGLKSLPPKPGLKISRVSQGIVLSWNMVVQEIHADISSYQLFAYQESSAPASTSLWKKVGDVKALPLPMACTLTQFQEGNKYHFSVRAVDIHNRYGEFSDPSTIHLLPK